MIGAPCRRPAAGGPTAAPGTPGAPNSAVPSAEAEERSMGSAPGAIRARILLCPEPSGAPRRCLVRPAPLGPAALADGTR